MGNKSNQYNYPLCSTEEKKKSYGFGTKLGGVNDDIMFIFG